MQKFTIKTHHPRALYSKPHFFILNKGMNCGKPLKGPCPNCFVLQFNDQTDLDNHFLMAYSLWQTKYWHKFLIGSVIPYFRIHAFASEFNRKCERMQLDFSRHQKQMKALQILEERETYYNENVKLIKQMRSAILSYYINI